MKTVFTKDGVVVSVCFSETGADFSCAIDGSEKHVVQPDTQVEQGWAFSMVEGVRTFLPPAQEAPKITPVQFKLCFLPAERVAIKEARKTDAMLEDAYEILDDPRLTFVDLGLQSTLGLIDRMVDLNLITAQRAADVKSGKII